MSLTNTQHVPAGSVLTIMADAVSSGTIYRVPYSGDNTTSYGAQSISASSSLVLGPFTKDRQYLITSAAGLLTAALSSPDQNASQSPVTLMGSDGAIVIAPGLVVFTKSASAIAATLAAPTAEQNGLPMILTAATAKAHQITATGLLQDGVTGGGKNTATFAAFLGSSLTLIAYNLNWHVVSANNVTIA